MILASCFLLAAPWPAPAADDTPRATSEISSPPSFWLEEMTSPEVRAFIDAGGKTVIIPTGGTEQNGAHMALGKHNFILRVTAQKVAANLGAALIAPVMAYVPEGDIAPPAGHMRLAGTLSLSQATFAAMLEETARSLKAHGFALICFLGDSGGNQPAQAAVAQKLSREWQGSGAQVLHVSDYYDTNGQEAWLLKQGFAPQELNGHAALEDTSELLAAHPAAVREALVSKSGDPKSGSTAPAAKATAKLGEKLLELKITAAIRQIRAARGY